MHDWRSSNLRFFFFLAKDNDIEMQDIEKDSAEKDNDKTGDTAEEGLRLRQDKTVDIDTTRYRQAIDKTRQKQRDARYK